MGSLARSSRRAAGRGRPQATRQRGGGARLASCPKPYHRRRGWVGRTGDGYRYDHIFCSRSLIDVLRTCDYIAEPRLARLSDHSALTVSLNLEPTVNRRISDASSSLQPLSLF